MKKKSYNRFAWKMIAILLLVMQPTLNAIEPRQELQCPVVTLLITPQDLYFDQETILTNVYGSPYIVHSLIQNGSQWIAQVSSYGTCPWGHPLCAYCGLCHHRICPLYQSRCSGSK